MLSEQKCLDILLPSPEHCMTGLAASAKIVAVDGGAVSTRLGRHRRKNAAS